MNCYLPRVWLKKNGINLGRKRVRMLCFAARLSFHMLIPWLRVWVELGKNLLFKKQEDVWPASCSI